ncbi:MAG: hypothetical protein GF411_02960 [Candidatus Lokiarchaeota archaeon]|nr:hypothetical protein [Candidatus Lokiarchaeota archaeon]
MTGYNYVTFNPSYIPASGSTSDIPLPQKSYQWRTPVPTIFHEESMIVKKSDTSLRSSLNEQILLKRVMKEVESYFMKMVPMIISMATERWIPIIGNPRKYTEGMFCFNCGAAIIRGQETEECEYYGR